MKNLILICMIVVLESACSSTPKPQGVLLKTRSELVSYDQSLKKSFLETGVVEVSYATNRDRGGVNPGPEITYGAARVNVPGLHSIGVLTPPEAAFNPEQQYKVLEDHVQSPADWKAQLATENDFGLLIFIHGFNVDFQSALFRASQIAYDLKFQGKMVLLSWPAGASGNLLERSMLNRVYEQNSKNAKESIEPFSRVIVDLSSLQVPIQVLAHSMGHQVLVPALEKVAAAATYTQPIIQELILNAPDFDPEDFQRSLPSLKMIAGRITLYCSEKDQALRASKTLNQKKRLGACALQDGVDVINVSLVDDLGLTGLGHGYYASKPVLMDVEQTLLGISAKNRWFIRTSGASQFENYFLRK